MLHELKIAIKQKQVVIENVVKQKGNIKEVRKVKINDSHAELLSIYESISNRAKKQKVLVEWMMNHVGEILDPERNYQ